MLRLIFRSLGVTRFRGRAPWCSVEEHQGRAPCGGSHHAGGSRSATLVGRDARAAVGAGLPIHEPVGSLVVDIGGGTTEVAVVAMGGIVTGTSMPVGGFDLDRSHPAAHPAALRRGHRRRSAERVKIGSARPTRRRTRRRLSIRGRDRRPRFPRCSRSRPRRSGMPARTGPVMVGATKRCGRRAGRARPRRPGTGIFLTGGAACCAVDMRLSGECECPVR
jgi:rod shape-determining protein MreB